MSWAKADGATYWDDIMKKVITVGLAFPKTDKERSIESVIPRKRESRFVLS